MGREIQRQIRYNMKTDPGEQISMRHRWVFLVINDPRETERIKQKIYTELAPVDDLNEIDSGLIRNSRGLHYSLFALSSEKGKIESPESIYRSSNFRRDRNLREQFPRGLSVLFNF
jgi:hypothetical protein